MNCCVPRRQRDQVELDPGVHLLDTPACHPKPSPCHTGKATKMVPSSYPPPSNRTVIKVATPLTKRPTLSISVLRIPYEHDLAEGGDRRGAGQLRRGPCWPRTLPAFTPRPPSSSVTALRSCSYTELLSSSRLTLLVGLSPGHMLIPQPEVFSAPHPCLGRPHCSPPPPPMAPHSPSLLRAPPPKSSRSVGTDRVAGLPVTSSRPRSHAWPFISAR